MVRINRLPFLLPLLVALSALPSARAAVQPWVPVGPNGGDARSFAADPSNSRHLYLGTTNSLVYESIDGGSSWRRLAKLSAQENLIIDNLLVDQADPRTLFVGAWVVDHPDGGLFVSHDGGKTWSAVQAMTGQSIRALSQAPSNPRILVAGTLKGVFRSDDGAVTWKQISPPNDNQLHEVESIAIDPKDPAIVYAGTWHLPWKTTDGGATWHNIKQGLIDDSDVFSIIVDPTTPNVVYTSACSGIYRSDNGGELYKKVQGIPATARRTRVLMQDPVDHNTVYAGTTEGLYKTVDGGTRWQRTTGPDVIVNDVSIDPKNPRHILLATDRSGVLESEDAGVSFQASNTGFMQRQVSALLVDAKDPQTIYAGVVNDKTYGGVFASHDGGANWQQQSKGLDGRDIFALTEAPDGTLLAGTNKGIFRWNGSSWIPLNVLKKQQEKTVYAVHKRKRVKETRTITIPGGEIESHVSALDLQGDHWYAATSSGVYVSDNQGTFWLGGPVLEQKDFLAVSASGPEVVIAARKLLADSQDAGKTWQAIALPRELSWVRSLVLAPDGSLWLAGREGVFWTRDRGQNWQQLTNLPFSDINDLSYNDSLKRIFITSWSSTQVIALDPATRQWRRWDAGRTVRNVRTSQGRLLAASLFNSVVMQPQGEVNGTSAATAASASAPQR